MSGIKIKSADMHAFSENSGSEFTAQKGLYSIFIAFIFEFIIALDGIVIGQDHCFITKLVTSFYKLLYRKIAVGIF
jgi:hypothetical protein